MPDLIIDPQWKKPPFYDKDTNIIEAASTNWKEEMSTHPFLAEIAFQNGLAGYEFWEDPFPALEHWQTYWQQNKIEIKHHIAVREAKKALPLIIPAISGIIESYFWMNGKPAGIGGGSWEALDIVPVNGKERIDFICSRPVHHHSYAQLNELYEESRRKAAVLKRTRM